MESDKRHLTDGMELSNQDKIRTLEEKETQIIGLLWGWHYQTRGDKIQN